MGTYSWVWKWIALDWNTWFTFYGKDFNPNVPSIPSWNTFRASGETSNFDLTGFQPWNEVWCYVWNVNTSNQVWNLYVESFFKRWGVVTWQYDWSFRTESSYDLYAWYMYFWVDSDEIWDSSSSYTIETNRELRFDWWGSDWENWITTNFTVSNLSIDADEHSSWYLWIEWNYLCYTDATYSWNMWYKHKINYDTGYSWWSGEPWYIWIPSWTTWRIYYTDAYWTVRRTHLADTRYGWSLSPSSAKIGNIRVSNWDYYDWYWYLCFVDGNWELRRLWNWVP